MPSPHLSVIIPAFNEESRILPTLQKIEAFLRAQSYSWEVIVVDDCSRDRTLSIVGQFISGKPNFSVLKNDVNMGKGASVKRGMLAATGEFRLFSDADLSTPIEEVAKLLKIISPPFFDVVIGSRRVRGANVAKRQPIFREGSGRIFSVLVRLLTLRGFLDTQCGFKLFGAASAQAIFPRQTIHQFGFDVEILYIAKKLGYHIREVGITWFDSPLTRVRLLHDSTMMFMDLLRIRLNDLRHRYK